jgi:two-component system, OmpR family, sensor histidine kinase CpxA
MIRTIYTKIFLWFWLATIAVTASVLILTLVTGAQPLGHRWMSRTLDFYARAAVDFYGHGGAPELKRYLDDVGQHSGIHAVLIDPQGRNILARPIPPGCETVLEKARATGRAQFAIGLRWNGASIVTRAEGQYILVAQVLPVRGLWTPGMFAATLARFLIALVSAGILCWLLARHIASPIRTLQTVASRIAGGDLSVRAMPALPARNDELADLARDFDRMAERIEALLQRQQEMLGNISHELRSPLARLGVSLELVRRGETDAVERMQADLDRLDELIGQILTLTRLQHSNDQKPESLVNLRTLVESIAEDARFEGQTEGKSVVVQHAEDCSLKGDPLLLRSCIENVVRNAMRYTAPKTDVEVRLTLGNASPGSARLAHIVVADHGPGVPPEALPHLFEPFYRVAASANLSTNGTGLGLTIAQRVAEHYGGSVTARNRTTGGLEIEIRLPAASAPRPTAG